MSDIFLSTLTAAIISLQTIFQVNPADTARDVSCYRIPALTTAPDGSLIAAIDERVPSCGDLKWSRDINIVIRRSTDGGRTWGPVIRAADFPDGQSASDPSMITDTATATVWLFYNFMDHDTAPGSYRFHVMSSRDNGATWSEPTDITSQVAPDGWENDFKFLTSGQGTVTRDGRLLHTMVNLDKGLHIIESNDHGISWHLLPAAITPADESKILELPDGRWMISSRVNGQAAATSISPKTRAAPGPALRSPSFPTPDATVRLHSTRSSTHQTLRDACFPSMPQIRKSGRTLPFATAWTRAEPGAKG